MKTRISPGRTQSNIKQTKHNRRERNISESVRAPPPPLIKNISAGNSQKLEKTTIF